MARAEIALLMSMAVHIHFAVRLHRARHQLHERLDKLPPLQQALVLDSGPAVSQADRWIVARTLKVNRQQRSGFSIPALEKRIGFQTLGNRLC